MVGWLKQPSGPFYFAMGWPPEQQLLATLEGPGITVEVGVTPQGDERKIVGQLIPPRIAQMKVRWRDGCVYTESDSAGLFHVVSVPAGLISIVCRPAGEGGPQLATSWTRI